MQIFSCADDHAGVIIEADGIEDLGAATSAAVKGVLAVGEIDFEGFAGERTTITSLRRPGLRSRRFL